MSAIAIIPARYASTRFPGKPLARETGKFLIQHVYEQAARAKSLSQIIVATDDDRIASAVRSFGGLAELTRPDHPTGTDRIAEIAARLTDEIIVNLQGDEPEIDPAHIDRLVALLDSDPSVSIATLAAPFPADSDPSDPNAVKVVLSGQSRALYFSRSLIPYPRDSAGSPQSHPRSNWLLHLGIYAYRRETLIKLASLPTTPLEQLEKLEQLRFLEHGFPIAVATVPHATPGIDTPDDYAAFINRIK